MGPDPRLLESWNPPKFLRNTTNNVKDRDLLRTLAGNIWSVRNVHQKAAPKLDTIDFFMHLACYDEKCKTHGRRDGKPSVTWRNHWKSDRSLTHLIHPENHRALIYGREYSAKKKGGYWNSSTHLDIRMKTRRNFSVNSKRKAPDECIKKPTTTRVNKQWTLFALINYKPFRSYSKLCYVSAHQNFWCAET